MAKVKIKPETDLKRVISASAKRAIKVTVSDWQKVGSKILKIEILAAMNRGVSPVAGEGRYDKYSRSYAQQLGHGAQFARSEKRRTGPKRKRRRKSKLVKLIGKAKSVFAPKKKKTKKKKVFKYGKQLRPVNLKVTGKMHRSLGVSKVKDGLKVKFSNPLAHIHSELGAGRKKVIRRIFPKEGSNQTFSRVILRKLRKLLRKSFEINLREDILTELKKHKPK